MKYGLVGKNIDYSYSPLIHSMFGNNEYKVYSLNDDELKELLTTKNFCGINITIPYKQEVIKYLDVIDDSVKTIGACNLIVNKNNKLYGYNVDYYGLLENCKKTGFDFKGKNVAILGSGATSKTATAVLNTLGVKNIYVISRSKTEYTYSDLDKLNIDFMINTTPVGGMYNDNLITPIPKNVKGVVDVIYRPLLTKILLEAKHKGLIYRNGLYMLVHQAYLTHLKFFDLEFKHHEIRRVFNEALKLNTNIYLIGMPYSGKTSVGKLLANKLNKNFIDIDEEIVKEEKMDIKDIFKLKGEAYFRDLESKKIKEYKFKPNSVISLGGGAILREENMIDCEQSGIIYLIKRDIDKINFDETRPLSCNKSQYISLFLEREKLYNKYSSKEFINNSSLEEIVNEMERDFNETINS